VESKKSSKQTLLTVHCLQHDARETARRAGPSATADSELSMGWVDPSVGLGRVGSRFFSFWWVGLGLL